MRLRPDYSKIRRLEIALGFREPDTFSFEPGAIWYVSDPREIVAFTSPFIGPAWFVSSESPVEASLPASEPQQDSQHG